MRIERGPLALGVFFIAAGAVPLAAGTGYLPAGAIAGLWRLWPLILVGLGIGFILGRSALGLLGGVVVAATLGLLAGSVFAGDPGPGFCGLERFASEGAAASLDGELADGATVELDFACGPLMVGTGPGPGWALLYRYDPGAIPDVSSTPGRLRLASPAGGFLDRGSEWEVTLPSTPTLALELEANAASVELSLRDARYARLGATVNASSVVADLTGARLGALHLRLNAASGSITLPAATFDGSIVLNAASLDLCVPPEAGLRITTSGALSNTDFGGGGLVLAGSSWESPGYATADSRIDLRITANAASVTLHGEGGCP